MLANAFGAIIGSLQGSDPNSPEVAVVVACLHMLCDRLTTTKEQQLEEAEEAEEAEESKRVFELRDVTIQTGLEVLIIALELVPGTALIPVWDMLASVIGSTQGEQRDLFMQTLASNVNQMENGSRRAVVTRKLLGMDAYCLKSKL